MTKERILVLLRSRKLGLLAAPFALFFMFRWFERSQVYHPTRPYDASPSALGLACRDVGLVTSDRVRLHAWFFPAQKSPSAGKTVVLIAHGNGGNISHRLPLCHLLLELGLDVMAFDYRGYGQSEGSPSEEGTYRDARAARDWLLKEGYRELEIVLLGESLGGGVAAEVAAHEVSGGLILLSTFTSVPDLGAELFPWLPVRMLSRIRYDTMSKLGRVKAPVLVLHSREDQLIGFHHAERNYAAANAPKRLSEIRGDHNDAIEEDRTNIQERIRDFLKAGGGL